MRVRSLLVFTAFVSSILGAVAAYLVLSVPNDLKADSMLENARKDITAGRNDKATDSLSQIVQQYPRTDAAAAATVALARIAEQEQQRLEAELKRLRAESERHNRLLADLQKSVQTIRSTPPPVAKPAPKPTPKRTPAKRTPTRRRR
jgi:DNA gyrase/topoisomerase IV subunit A